MVKNMQYVGIRFKVVGLGGFYQCITCSAGICPTGGVGEQPRFSSNGEGPDVISGQHITDIQMALIALARECAPLILGIIDGFSGQ